jgi:histone H3/H4
MWRYIFSFLPICKTEQEWEQGQVSALFVYQEKDYHYQQQRRQETTATAALEDYHENFKRCARRLSARAGVLAASDAALEQLKEAGKKYLQRVLHHAIVEAEHHHSTVIAVSQIHVGLRLGGFAAVVGVGSVGVHVVGQAFDLDCAQVDSVHKLSLQMMCQMQQSALPCFPRQNIVMACNEAVGSASGTTLDDLAYEVISVGYENYLVGIMEDANLCAIHAKRIVVLQEDVAIALRITHVGYS